MDSINNSITDSLVETNVVVVDTEIVMSSRGIWDPSSVVFASVDRLRDERRLKQTMENLQRGGDSLTASVGYAREMDNICTEKDIGTLLGISHDGEDKEHQKHMRLVYLSILRHTSDNDGRMEVSAHPDHGYAKEYVLEFQQKWHINVDQVVLKSVLKYGYYSNALQSLRGNILHNYQLASEYQKQYMYHQSVLKDENRKLTSITGNQCAIWTTPARVRYGASVAQIYGFGLQYILEQVGIGGESDEEVTKAITRWMQTSHGKLLFNGAPEGCNEIFLRKLQCKREEEITSECNLHAMIDVFTKREEPPKEQEEIHVNDHSLLSKQPIYYHTLYRPPYEANSVAKVHTTDALYQAADALMLEEAQLVTLAQELTEGDTVCVQENVNMDVREFPFFIAPDGVFYHPRAWKHALDGFINDTIATSPDIPQHRASITQLKTHQSNVERFANQGKRACEFIIPLGHLPSGICPFPLLPRLLKQVIVTTQQVAAQNAHTQATHTVLDSHQPALYVAPQVTLECVGTCLTKSSVKYITETIQSCLFTLPLYKQEAVFAKPKVVHAISKSTPNIPPMQSLNLECTGLTDALLEDLLAPLSREAPHLLGGVATPPIVELLLGNSQDVLHNIFSIRAARVQAEFSKNSVTLEKLSLTKLNNSFVATLVARAPWRSPTSNLQTLDLSQCHQTPGTLIALFASLTPGTACPIYGRCTNQPVRVLNISGSDQNDSNVMNALATMLITNPRIEKLDMSYCNISSHLLGARSPPLMSILAYALARAQGLSDQNQRGNPCGARGLWQLSHGLPTSKLVKLNVSNCEVRLHTVRLQTSHQTATSLVYHAESALPPLTPIEAYNMLKRPTLSPVDSPGLQGTTSDALHTMSIETAARACFVRFCTAIAHMPLLGELLISNNELSDDGTLLLSLALQSGYSNPIVLAALTLNTISSLYRACSANDVVEMTKICKKLHSTHRKTSSVDLLHLSAQEPSVQPLNIFQIMLSGFSINLDPTNLSSTAHIRHGWSAPGTYPLPIGIETLLQNIHFAGDSEVELLNKKNTSKEKVDDITAWIQSIQQSSRRNQSKTSTLSVLDVLRKVKEPSYGKYIPYADSTVKYTHTPSTKWLADTLRACQESVSHQLAIASGVTVLDLSNNRITDSGVAWLTPLIRGKTTIQTINLSSNFITSSVVKVWHSALSQRQNWESERFPLVEPPTYAGKTVYFTPEQLDRHQNPVCYSVKDIILHDISAPEEELVSFTEFLTSLQKQVTLYRLRTYTKALCGVLNQTLPHANTRTLMLTSSIPELHVANQLNELEPGLYDAVFAQTQDEAVKRENGAEDQYTLKSQPRVSNGATMELTLIDKDVEQVKKSNMKVLRELTASLNENRLHRDTLRRIYISLAEVFYNTTLVARVEQAVALWCFSTLQAKRMQQEQDVEVCERVLNDDLFDVKLAEKEHEVQATQVLAQERAFCDHIKLEINKTNRALELEKASFKSKVELYTVKLHKTKEERKAQCSMLQSSFHERNIFEGMQTDMYLSVAKVEPVALKPRFLPLRMLLIPSEYSVQTSQSQHTHPSVMMRELVSATHASILDKPFPSVAAYYHAPPPPVVVEKRGRRTDKPAPPAVVEALSIHPYSANWPIPANSVAQCRNAWNNVFGTFGAAVGFAQRKWSFECAEKVREHMTRITKTLVSLLVGHVQSVLTGETRVDDGYQGLQSPLSVTSSTPSQHIPYISLSSPSTQTAAYLTPRCRTSSILVTSEASDCKTQAMLNQRHAQTGGFGLGLVILHIPGAEWDVKHEEYQNQVSQAWNWEMLKIPEDYSLGHMSLLRGSHSSSSGQINGKKRGTKKQVQFTNDDIESNTENNVSNNSTNSTNMNETSVSEQENTPSSSTDFILDDTFLVPENRSVTNIMRSSITAQGLSFPSLVAQCLQLQVDTVRDIHTSLIQQRNQPDLADRTSSKYSDFDTPTVPELERQALSSMEGKGMCVMNGARTLQIYARDAQKWSKHEASETRSSEGFVIPPSSGLIIFTPTYSMPLVIPPLQLPPKPASMGEYLPALLQEVCRQFTPALLQDPFHSPGQTADYPLIPTQETHTKIQSNILANLPIKSLLPLASISSFFAQQYAIQPLLPSMEIPTLQSMVSSLSTAALFGTIYQRLPVLNPIAVFPLPYILMLVKWLQSVHAQVQSTPHSTSQKFLSSVLMKYNINVQTTHASIYNAPKKTVSTTLSCGDISNVQIMDPKTVFANPSRRSSIVSANVMNNNNNNNNNKDKDGKESTSSVLHPSLTRALSNVSSTNVHTPINIGLCDWIQRLSHRRVYPGRVITLHVDVLVDEMQVTSGTLREIFQLHDVEPSDHDLSEEESDVKDHMDQKEQPKVAALQKDVEYLIPEDIAQPVATIAPTASSKKAKTTAKKSGFVPFSATSPVKPNKVPTGAVLLEPWLSWGEIVAKHAIADGGQFFIKFAPKALQSKTTYRSSLAPAPKDSCQYEELMEGDRSSQYLPKFPTPTGLDTMDPKLRSLLAVLLRLGHTSAAGPQAQMDKTEDALLQGQVHVTDISPSTLSAIAQTATELLQRYEFAPQEMVSPSINTIHAKTSPVSIHQVLSIAENASVLSSGQTSEFQNYWTGFYECTSSAEAQMLQQRMKKQHKQKGADWLLSRKQILGHNYTQTIITPGSHVSLPPVLESLQYQALNMHTDQEQSLPNQSTQPAVLRRNPALDPLSPMAGSSVLFSNLAGNIQVVDALVSTHQQFIQAATVVPERSSTTSLIFQQKPVAPLVPKQTTEPLLHQFSVSSRALSENKLLPLFPKSGLSVSVVHDPLDLALRDLEVREALTNVLSLLARHDMVTSGRPILGSNPGFSRAPASSLWLARLHQAQCELLQCMLAAMSKPISQTLFPLLRKALHVPNLFPTLGNAGYLATPSIQAIFYVPPTTPQVNLPQTTLPLCPVRLREPSFAYSLCLPPPSVFLYHNIQRRRANLLSFLARQPIGEKNILPRRTDMLTLPSTNNVTDPGLSILSLKTQLLNSTFQSEDEPPYSKGDIPVSTVYKNNLTQVSVPTSAKTGLQRMFQSAAPVPSSNSTQFISQWNNVAGIDAQPIDILLANELVEMLAKPRIVKIFKLSTPNDTNTQRGNVTQRGKKNTTQRNNTADTAVKLPTTVNMEALLLTGAASSSDPLFIQTLSNYIKLTSIDSTNGSNTRGTSSSGLGRVKSPNGLTGASSSNMNMVIAPREIPTHMNLQEVSEAENWGIDTFATAEYHENDVYFKFHVTLWLLYLNKILPEYMTNIYETILLSPSSDISAIYQQQLIEYTHNISQQPSLQVETLPATGASSNNKTLILSKSVDIMDYEPFHVSTETYTTIPVNTLIQEFAKFCLSAVEVKGVDNILFPTVPTKVEPQTMPVLENNTGIVVDRRKNGLLRARERRRRLLEQEARQKSSQSDTAQPGSNTQEEEEDEEEEDNEDEDEDDEDTAHSTEDSDVSRILHKGKNSKHGKAMPNAPPAVEMIRLKMHSREYDLEDCTLEEIVKDTTSVISAIQALREQQAELGEDPDEEDTRSLEDQISQLERYLHKLKKVRKEKLKSAGMYQDLEYTYGTDDENENDVEGKNGNSRSRHRRHRGDKRKKKLVGGVMVLEGDSDHDSDSDGDMNSEIDIAREQRRAQREMERILEFKQLERLGMLQSLRLLNQQQRYDQLKEHEAELKIHGERAREILRVKIQHIRDQNSRRRDAVSKRIHYLRKEAEIVYKNKVLKLQEKDQRILQQKSARQGSKRTGGGKVVTARVNGTSSDYTSSRKQQKNTQTDAKQLSMYKNSVLRRHMREQARLKSVEDKKEVELQLEQRKKAGIEEFLKKHKKKLELAKEQAKLAANELHNSTYFRTLYGERRIHLLQSALTKIQDKHLRRAMFEKYIQSSDKRYMQPLQRDVIEAPPALVNTSSFKLNEEQHEQLNMTQAFIPSTIRGSKEKHEQFLKTLQSLYTSTKDEEMQQTQEPKKATSKYDFQGTREVMKPVQQGYKEAHPTDISKEAVNFLLLSGLQTSKKHRENALVERLYKAHLLDESGVSGLFSKVVHEVIKEHELITNSDNEDNISLIKKVNALISPNTSSHYNLASPRRDTTQYSLVPEDPRQSPSPTKGKHQTIGVITYSMLQQEEEQYEANKNTQHEDLVQENEDHYHKDMELLEDWKNQSLTSGRQHEASSEMQFMQSKFLDIGARNNIAFEAYDEDDVSSDVEDDDIFGENIVSIGKDIEYTGVFNTTSNSTVLPPLLDVSDKPITVRIVPQKESYVAVSYSLGAQTPRDTSRDILVAPHNKNTSQTIYIQETTDGMKLDAEQRRTQITPATIYTAHRQRTDQFLISHELALPSIKQQPNKK